MAIWKLATGDVVRPYERLSWPQTIAIGMQHVVAMFGATFLVPLLTGMSPATTLLFSGIGTLVFMIITRNQVPSYLGSSFAFIAPVTAAKTSGGPAAAFGAIFVAGVMLFLVGLVINAVGATWINRLMPPAVTGVVVALIGLNLASVAIKNLQTQSAYGLITILAIVIIAAATRGFAQRISIFLGALVGWVLAGFTGGIDAKATQAVADAKWFGLPEFGSPSFSLATAVTMIPVVIVLIAENTGHVKAVGTMTGENLDRELGRAFMGDGVATTVAGLFGGSGTTTYAENIGVMAATKVYSTAVYVVASITAIGLGLCPKFGAVILTMPLGVLGGVTVILYGMIGVLGARIWKDNQVDLHQGKTSMPIAIGLILAIGDFTLTIGEFTFAGIATATVSAIVTYHLMHALSRDGATTREEDKVASPASA